MNTLLSFLLAGLLSASSALAADQPGNLKITPDMLFFHYSTFDAGETMDCKPTVENADSQDWRVVCSNSKSRREYTVHLWVSIYTHSAAPLLSYEILYWVTDLTDPAHSIQTGSTVWFHVNDPTSLASLEISDTVDDGTAGLYLTVSTVAKDAAKSLKTGLLK